MLTLGEKIKKIRISNNLKQSELADMLFVSEKTISSWENNRTVPDLNMIYRISDYFKKSFYYLINDDYDTDNISEIEIKLKVDKDEYNKIAGFDGQYDTDGNVYIGYKSDGSAVATRKWVLENGGGIAKFG